MIKQTDPEWSYQRRFLYEIADMEAFNKYMIRKHPNTKRAFLYAVNERTSLSEAARQNEITIPTMNKHSRNLKKLGILKARRLYPPPVSQKKRTKINLRNKIRSLLMYSDIEKLEMALNVLRESPTEATK